MAFAKADKGQIVKVRKIRVKAEKLVGVPFGARFRMDRSDLIPIEEPEIPATTAAASSAQIEPDTSSSDPNKKDNRLLDDTNTAQALSMEEIKEMKKAGIDVVDKLISNSKTFAKTKFVGKSTSNEKESMKLLSAFLNATK